MIARGTMHRGSALWIAAMVHRLSGLALAMFLPLHFLVLALAIVLVFVVLLFEFRSFSAPVAILSSALLSLSGISRCCRVVAAQQIGNTSTPSGRATQSNHLAQQWGGQT